MKLARILLPLLLLATPFAAARADAERGPALPDYPADKVAANTWVIHGPVGYPSPENQGFMNNPAFVVTPAGVVVVDPGSSVQTGEMVLRQIRKVTDQPVAAVLNTHVHGDHWLGNHAFRNADPEVPIYAHPKMLEEVKKGAGEEWVGRMLRATEGATRGTEVRGPNLAVGNGDEVTIGGVTFRFHSEGQVHTWTDLMIEVEQEDVLFLADNANNQRIVRMDDGSFKGSIAFLEKMRAENKRTILIPGHGLTGDWGIVDDYIAYLKGVRGKVAELFEEGMSDFEMKDAVADSMPRFHDWPGYLDTLGKHISLAYLEIEAEAF